MCTRFMARRHDEILWLVLAFEIVAQAAYVTSRACFSQVRLDDRLSSQLRASHGLPVMARATCHSLVQLARHSAKV